MVQTNVNIRDEGLKQQFERLCMNWGYMSTAFNNFARTTVRQQGDLLKFPLIFPMLKL